MSQEKVMSIVPLLREFNDGDREVTFSREDVAETAKILGHALPKNLGDVIGNYIFN